MSTENKNPIESFDPSIRPSLERSLEAMELLEQATKNSNAKMSEPEFRNSFLPYLIKPKDKSDVRLDIWWDKVGSPMKGIDVYDPSTKKIIFTVPPVLRTHDGESIDLSSGNLTEIILIAAKKSNVIPNMGKRHLDENLISNIKTIEPRTQDIFDWNNILLRYGLEPIIDPKKIESQLNSTEKTEEEKKPDNSFDDDEFEDL